MEQRGRQRAGQGSLQDRRPDPVERRAPGDARGAQRGKADPRHARRGDGGRPVLRVLRGRRHEDPRRDHPSHGAGSRLHPPRAGRCGGLDRPMEFPADHRLLEGRPRTGRGQRRHPQAGELHATDRVGAGTPGPRGGTSGRCTQRHHRPRRQHRQRARRTSRCRQDRLYRRDPDRGQHPPASGSEHHAGIPGARRKIPEHRVCGRGSREGCAGRGQQRLW